MKLKIFLLTFAVLLTSFASYFISSNKKQDTNSNNIEDLLQSVANLNLALDATKDEEIKELDLPEPEINSNEVKLLFFGDTATLEPLGSRIVTDLNYNPLKNVQDKFKEYDYVIGNHEATIDGSSVGVPNPGKPYTFSVPKESVQVYKNAGIDAFSYANNHTKDYGPASVMHTIELLNSAGIDTFGSGSNSTESFTALVREFKGNKIGFLAYNCAEYAFNISGPNEPGTAYFNEWLVRDSISRAKQQADIVIVVSHCGDEHVTQPNDLQKQWAGIYTSAGADFVIGGHPHVRQSADVVNGKNVVYSVGNFKFPGQAWDPEAQLGWAVEIVVEDKAIKNYKLIEMQMDSEGIPSWK